MPGDFTFNNKYGTPHPLKRLNVNEGLDIIWVFITMDGNQTDQLNNLREK